jgi:hypothetical protein
MNLSMGRLRRLPLHEIVLLKVEFLQTRQLPQRADQVWSSAGANAVGPVTKTLRLHPSDRIDFTSGGYDVIVRSAQDIVFYFIAAPLRPHKKTEKWKPWILPATSENTSLLNAHLFGHMIVGTKILEFRRQVV